MENFIITGFSDEIDERIDKQFSHIKSLGIEYFEPRFVDGISIADLNDYAVRALKDKMERAGVKVSSIGSPIGKIKITDPFEPHLEKLARVIDIAKILGTKYIRVFSYYIDKGDDLEKWHDEVIYRMKKMTELAEKEGVMLLHENEKDIWGELPEQCDRIIREVNSPALRAVFDPANFIQAGATPYPDAYNIMKPHIEYMHIKDALADGTVVPSGCGVGRIDDILADLSKSGWTGFLSLEPHLGAFKGLAGLELDDNMLLLDGATPEKFTLAYNSLMKVIDKITVKLRYGIIGMGNMGSTHAKSFVEGKVKEGELTAVCDIDEAKRAACMEKFPQIPVFENAEELFKSGLVDAVIIAVPHYDHPSIVIKAFEYGLHVITEKPAGVYTKQVLEMNEAAEKSDKHFGIMYNQRTNPTYALIRKMVQSGELGHIKRVEWTITTWFRPQAYHDSAAWRSTWETEGGGALINQNPHQLDLWQWMFGMPKRIMSHVYFGKYRDIEVEDEVTAFMEYENGMTGVYITSTAEAPGTNRLEIACDMGRLIVENNTIVFDRNKVSEPEFNKTTTSGFNMPECETIEPNVTGDAGTQHVGVFNDFTSAVLHSTPMLAPGVEGINGLTISNAIHYSTWKGNVWVDVDNFPHDDFYAELEKKIASSTVKKTVRETKAVDLAGTY